MSSPQREGHDAPQDASPSPAAAHIVGLPWAKELLPQGDVAMALDDSIELLLGISDFFDADDHFAIRDVRRRPPQRRQPAIERGGGGARGELALMAARSRARPEARGNGAYRLDIARRPTS